MPLDLVWPAPFGARGIDNVHSSARDHRVRIIDYHDYCKPVINQTCSFGNGFGSFGGHVGAIFALLWDCFWLTLELFWDSGGVVLGHLGGIWGASWHYFGVILESSWNHL